MATPAARQTPSISCRIRASGNKTFQRREGLLTRRRCQIAARAETRTLPADHGDVKLPRLHIARFLFREPDDARHSRRGRLRQDVRDAAVRPIRSAMQVDAGDLVERRRRQCDVVAQLTRPAVERESRRRGERDVRRRNRLRAGRGDVEAYGLADVRRREALDKAMSDGKRWQIGRWPTPPCWIARTSTRAR